MRSFIWLLVVVSLIGGGSESCFGQQPGPATLEGLLNSGGAQEPANAAEADATDAGPKGPAGTVARPTAGVQHPDLDKAWADYDAAVTTAAEGIRSVINKQFEAATAKGDLDAAEKWQNALEKFEKAGELPADNETKVAVNAAVSDYKKARDELSKAYEAVVKSLTMEKKIAEAKAARDEAKGLRDMSTQNRKVAAAVEQASEKTGRTASRQRAERLPPAVQVEVPAFKHPGFTFGEGKKGDVLILQYVAGTWTHWRGQEPPESPDTGRFGISVVGDRDGNHFGFSVPVPKGTAANPFRLVLDRDVRGLSLAFGDPTTHDNEGTVIYKVVYQKADARR